MKWRRKTSARCRNWPWTYCMMLVCCLSHQDKTDRIKYMLFFFSGVIFQTNKDGSLPPHVLYKIRQNSSFTEKTNEIRRAYWRPGPNTGGKFYFLYGFVWIQGNGLMKHGFMLEAWLWIWYIITLLYVLPWLRSENLLKWIVFVQSADCNNLCYRSRPRHSSTLFSLFYKEKDLFW